MMVGGGVGERKGLKYIEFDDNKENDRQNYECDRQGLIREEFYGIIWIMVFFEGVLIFDLGFVKFILIIVCRMS